MEAHSIIFTALLRVASSSFKDIGLAGLVRRLWTLHQHSGNPAELPVTGELDHALIFQIHVLGGAGCPLAWQTSTPMRSRVCQWQALRLAHSVDSIRLLFLSAQVSILCCPSLFSQPLA